MRAAAILGPGASPKDVTPFQRSSTTWLSGLPANASDVDAILIFGGDGTVHRYLAQLVELHLPVLVVPCGSGNDFARALGLGRQHEALAAWAQFVKGGSNVWTIDLGVIAPLAGEAPAPHEQRRYFCCVGGVGLDGEVARRANRLPRWLRGNGGYVLALFPALAEFTPSETTLTFPDGSSRPTRRILLTAFANTPTFGGGMRIAPHARLDDGKLDVLHRRQRQQGEAALDVPNHLLRTPPEYRPGGIFPGGRSATAIRTFHGRVRRWRVCVPDPGRG